MFLLRNPKYFKGNTSKHDYPCVTEVGERTRNHINNIKDSAHFCPLRKDGMLCLCSPVPVPYWKGRPLGNGTTKESLLGMTKYWGQSSHEWFSVRKKWAKEALSSLPPHEDIHTYGPGRKWILTIPCICGYLNFDFSASQTMSKFLFEKEGRKKRKRKKEGRGIWKQLPSWPQ